jgi:hypothetical protein
MFAFNRAAAEWKSRDGELLEAKKMQTGNAANHVRDRIGCADFVKMNFLRRGVMYFRFGLSETAENVQGLIAHRIRQVGFVDDFFDVMKMAMRVLVRRAYVDFGRINLAALDLARVQPQPGNAEAIRNLLQFVKGNTGVNQRAEDHIAAGAGDAVKVGETGHGKSVNRLV